ncbi:FCD domain-containing protein [Actinoallomurus sp. NPDC052274]|uniref:GntR family transcriptional regulator n=1 Tax=Actinoallomurus sp. NPDC052274 TaxID=3155420 RepID=UPI00341FADA7
MADRASGEGGSKQRRAEQVYQRLRADIFNATLAPGQRLKFPDLCATYDISVGVAREVLTRLAAERLVVSKAHQGYTVVELSGDELADLTTARVHIESLVFRESVLHGDASWEAQVLAAHHLLSRTPLPTDVGSDAMQEWSRAHEAFHQSLLGGCPSRRLRETAQTLRDEAELYRRWAGPLGTEPDRDLAGEHKALADAALARDADRAATLLRDHIAHTTEILISGVTAASPGNGDGQ